MNNLYKEEILEHYKDPQNFGRLEKFTTSSKQTNPFCGDEIEMFLKIDNGKIEDISFTGKGCAISIASTSLLTEYTKGKSVLELKDFSQKDMLELLGIEVSETRKKCALLSWGVLHDLVGRSQ